MRSHRQDCKARVTARNRLFLKWMLIGHLIAAALMAALYFGLSG
jgi:hypothetical protein